MVILTLNPNLDSQNYLNLNNPRPRLTPLKQVGLDFILTSDTLVDLVDVTDIKPSYISDHSFLYLQLTLTKFKTGK